MKVVVGGATGYVGQAVVRALLAAGHSPLALVRRGSPTTGGVLQRSDTQPKAAAVTSASIDETQAQASKLFPAGCAVSVVDWDNPETVARAAAGADAVIQAVGTIRAGAKLGSTYEKVDYGTTVSLLAAKPRRFVLLSAVGTAANSKIAYVQWKWKTEEVVREKATEWVIVRPSMIAGPGRAINRVLDPALSVVGLVASGVASKYRSIDRDRLAHVLVQALSAPPQSLLQGKSLWALA